MVVLVSWIETMFSFGLNSPVNMNVKSSFYDEPVTQEGLLRRWELIKESKKVRKQENTLSTRKAMKKKRKYFLFFLIIF